VKLLSAAQIREWDAFTIEQEPVSSIDLMERAAAKCVDWLLSQPFANADFAIFCGKGNNGSDGLAIARMLTEKGLQVDVYILEFGKMGSPDFQTNLQRLHELPVVIHFIQSEAQFPSFTDHTVIIDALYGTGLHKPLDGLSKSLVEYINNSDSAIVSIDLPSGLFADLSSLNNAVVKARYTLTFQVPKLAFYVAENAAYIGQLQVLDIGLSRDYYDNLPASFQTIELPLIRLIYKTRNRFTHKGNFGHSLLIGGSYGKIGAVVLSVSACLRCGSGLTSAYTPKCGYDILQMSVPEAMVMTGENLTNISNIDIDLSRFSAIGIGPGMGTTAETQKGFLSLLAQIKQPVVLDADALNCMALHPESITKLPPLSVLTPHPKEFDRLFGSCKNDFDRIETAINQAKKNQLVLVLKGHHTLIALPDGRAFFNTTGNAGLAKGGSGDVLTGMITSFLAQGYSSEEAALLGVYLHGLAADIAIRTKAMEALLASDVIETISDAFLSIS